MAQQEQTTPSTSRRASQDAGWLTRLNNTGQDAGWLAGWLHVLRTAHGLLEADAEQ
jgi:hypothetical protein